MGAKEGLSAFREYYRELKGTITRNSDGSLPVPTVLLFDDNNQMIGVANKVEELHKFV